MTNSWYKARTEKTAVYANTHHRRQARIVLLRFLIRVGMGVGNVHATAQVVAGNCLAVTCTRVWGGHLGGVGVFTVITAWSSHFQKRLKSCFKDSFKVLFQKESLRLQVSCSSEYRYVLCTTS